MLFEPIDVFFYFGPIAVFLGFWDLTLLLGRLPIVGNPIFLLVSILKVLAKYLLLFFPYLTAFAIVFRTLMPSTAGDATKTKGNFLTAI